MAKTDILTATENYGKAQTAFQIALANANSARELAMYNLGADFTTQGGKVLTPNEVGQALGGEGIPKSTTMSVGFGDRGISKIQAEQTGTTAEVVAKLQEQGISSSSGLTGQARLVSSDIGAGAKQAAVQAAQTEAAQASAEQAAAAMEEQQAQATYDTALGMKAVPAGKPGKPTAAQQKAAAQRASARAAANQKAKASVKPMPYSPGGTPKPPAPKKGGKK